MRCHDVRRQDGGDEGSHVADARDIAIRKPAAHVAGVRQKTGGGVRRNVKCRTADVDPKRLEMLAFDDWQTGRAKASAIVGGVQLAAEPGRPAISASKWREATHQALEQRQIARMSDIGNAKRGAADSPKTLGR